MDPVDERAREPDPQRIEAAAGRLLGILNDACLALMLSVGHRTGLLDALATAGAVTSDDLARRAELQERYVREWLGALVTGRLVTYDPDARTYRLPPEHAALLTRAAAPNNMSAFMQYIAVLGAVEDDVVTCFRSGGGVPYEAFHRFHEVMAEDSGQSVLPALVDRILPLAPGLPEALRAGIDVIDVGCGAGRALLLMAETYPRSRFVGLDLSEEAIGKARAEAQRRRIDNVSFVAKDAATWDAERAYDLVTTFDAIHDQADPARVLRAIHRALRPGGTYIMQDISGSGRLERDVDHPAGPMLYTVSTMHCMTVSLARGGAGLGTMWGQPLARRMLREAGFPDVQVHDLPHDFQNSYFVTHKAA